MDDDEVSGKFLSLLAFRPLHLADVTGVTGDRFPTHKMAAGDKMARWWTGVGWLAGSQDGGRWLVSPGWQTTNERQRYSGERSMIKKKHPLAGRKALLKPKSFFSFHFLLIAYPVISPH